MTYSWQSRPDEIKTLAIYNYSSSGPANQVLADHHAISEPAAQKNFGAEFKIDWQKEQLPEHAPKQHKEWDKARSYQKLLKHYEPERHAQLYLDAYPDHAPDRFYSTGSKRLHAAEAALAPSGWASKLLRQLDHPNSAVYFYSLHMAHLGLPLAYGDPTFIYYQAVIAEIKAALDRLIPKPYYWKIEVGRDGAVHVHAIAAAPGPALSPLLFDGSKVIQPVRHNEEIGLFCYLAKPTAPFTVSTYATYLQAVATKQTKTLPRLSGQLGLKKSRQKGTNYA